MRLGGNSKKKKKDNGVNILKLKRINLKTNNDDESETLKLSYSTCKCDVILPV